MRVFITGRGFVSDEPKFPAAKKLARMSSSARRAPLRVSVDLASALHSSVQKLNQISALLMAYGRPQQFVGAKRSRRSRPSRNVVS
jgi:hypothetical protein